MKFPSHLTYFFVTGLPRARSAWLSAWLTTDQAICFHDTPLSCFPDLNLNGRTHVGLAGPELAVAFKDYHSSYPAAPWLVVQRRDSFTAFKRVLDQFAHVDEQMLKGWWNERLQLLADICQQSGTLTVDFRDLDDPQTAERVWKHLLPGLPFDATRYETMNNLNIQQSHASQKVRRWASNQTKERN